MSDVLKLYGVLVCVSLVALVVPVAGLPVDGPVGPVDPVPVFHPSLGTTAGCDITQAPYFGHFQDPVAQNDCAWDPDGIDGPVEVLFFDCSKLCMVLATGKDADGVAGNFFISCDGGANGRYVITSDPLAELLLHDEGTDGCNVFSEGGSKPDTWVRSYGYIEDLSWLGGHFYGAIATDWRDVLLDELISV